MGGQNLRLYKSSSQTLKTSHKREAVSNRYSLSTTEKKNIHDRTLEEFILTRIGIGKFLRNSFSFSSIFLPTRVRFHISGSQKKTFLFQGGRVSDGWQSQTTRWPRRDQSFSPKEKAILDAYKRLPLVYNPRYEKYSNDKRHFARQKNRIEWFHLTRGTIYLTVCAPVGKTQKGKVLESVSSSD